MTKSYSRHFLTLTPPDLIHFSQYYLTKSFPKIFYKTFSHIFFLFQNFSLSSFPVSFCVFHSFIHHILLIFLSTSSIARPIIWFINFPSFLFFLSFSVTPFYNLHSSLPIILQSSDSLSLLLLFPFLSSPPIIITQWACIPPIEFKRTRLLLLHSYIPTTLRSTFLSSSLPLPPYSFL